MLILTCPYCGTACDETELTAGGEAHLKRATVGDTDEAFESYLFDRSNVKGVNFERWRHAYGCGKWFLAARDAMTLEVYATYPAQVPAPPKDVQAAIKKKKPEWEGL